jgi:hypothetical protein
MPRCAEDGLVGHLEKLVEVAKPQNLLDVLLGPVEYHGTAGFFAIFAGQEEHP